ncbi:MAG: ribonuclease III [Rhizobiaceae bacterium]|nr:ribonuclease III [Rhizobiaceae bacterium]
MARKRTANAAFAEQIHAITGHLFSDVALAQTALTHSSALRVSENNERLEFLGDRVLGLIVSEMLFVMFPDAPEGDLAVRLGALVSADTCADIALGMELDRHMHTDSALRSAGGRRARNVLADAMEALIAAVYLEGGLEAARAFVLRYWQPRAESAARPPRDSKTELQEWVVRFNGERPLYAVVGREGPDHEPIFTVALSVPGFAEVQAAGRSKQAAERAAATMFLVREGVWTEAGSES